ATLSRIEQCLARAWLVPVSEQCLSSAATQSGPHRLSRKTMRLHMPLLQCLFVSMLLQLPTVNTFALISRGPISLSHSSTALSADPTPISYRDEVERSLRQVRNALLLATTATATVVVGAEGAKAATTNNAVGYKAAESAFSPMQSLYAKPTLPQSALLNSLPLDSVLIGQLQAYLESFGQLLNPTPNQVRQIQRNTSALWTNLRINAQRA
ncbi:hypothetical protein B484DRAFT_102556, partial [Ochromonadaceae sp. CCMP2298]